MVSQDRLEIKLLHSYSRTQKLENGFL